MELTPNVIKVYRTLTSDKISKMSNGRIPKMSPQQAAGLIGSWAVETGDPTFNNLDVVEKVAGAGRGLSQYTGVRRIPYDRARAQAIQQGLDPNNIDWQLQYFADEYAGKYDQNGRSLVGWTQQFERAPQGLSAADYAQYYTGSADAGEGYFRPGVPHTERRRALAEQYLQAIQALPPGKPLQIPEVNRAQPAAAQPQSRPVGSQATLNGKPVVWAGDNYGWQSPGSFQQVQQQQQPQQQSNPLSIVTDLAGRALNALGIGGQ